MIQQQYTVNWDYVMSQCPKNEDVLLAIEGMPVPIVGQKVNVVKKWLGNGDSSDDGYRIGFEQFRVMTMQKIEDKLMWDCKSKDGNRGFSLVQPYAWAYLPVMPPTVCPESHLHTSDESCETCGNVELVQECPFFYLKKVLSSQVELAILDSLSKRWDKDCDNIVNISFSELVIVDYLDELFEELLKTSNSIRIQLPKEFVRKWFGCDNSHKLHVYLVNKVGILKDPSYKVTVINALLPNYSTGKAFSITVSLRNNQ